MEESQMEAVYYPRGKVLPGSSLVTDFPLIVINQGADLLMLYDFMTEEKEDYLILGKFKKDQLPNPQDYTYFNWLYHVKNMLDIYHQQPDKTIDYGRFFGASQTVLHSAFTKTLEFSQEGYDFITGKFLFTGGYIQRTMKMQQHFDRQKKFFGDECYPVDLHEEKPLFQDLDVYEREYFLNPLDLQLIEGNPSCIYALQNKGRITNYLKKKYPEWMEKHYQPPKRDHPVEMVQYSLQLLDVVSDFQLNKMETLTRKTR